MVKPSRIFIADTDAGLQYLSAALRDHELTLVTTLEEARRSLLNQYDLILIGVNFDESKGLDCMHLAARSLKNKLSPIVMLRLEPARFAATLRSAIINLMKYINIVDYLELEAFEDIRLNRVQAIRNAICRHLPLSNPLSISICEEVNATGGPITADAKVKL